MYGYRSKCGWAKQTIPTRTLTSTFFLGLFFFVFFFFDRSGERILGDSITAAHVYINLFKKSNQNTNIRMSIRHRLCWIYFHYPHNPDVTIIIVFILLFKKKIFYSPFSLSAVVVRGFAKVCFVSWSSSDSLDDKRLFAANIPNTIKNSILWL